MMPTAERKISTCEKHGETDFYLARDDRHGSVGYFRCVLCHREQQKKYVSLHPEMKTQNWRHRHGLARRMEDDKDCSLYLGVYIAERVLSKFFDNIQRMPINNPGYDFICSRGFKIDVKSSCLSETHWTFTIRKNHVADYFLCLAFNNRIELTPLHIWLIPSEEINHIRNLKIAASEKGLVRWSKYEKPLERVIDCCNKLRNAESTAISIDNEVLA